MRNYESDVKECFNEMKECLREIRILKSDETTRYSVGMKSYYMDKLASICDKYVTYSEYLNVMKENKA